MHETFYNLSYENLKQYLLNCNKPLLEELLRDPVIKKKLIDSPTRHDFIWLAQEENQEILPLLLSDSGIEILENTSERKEKFNGILTSNQPYVNTLLKQDAFNKLLTKEMDSLKDYFSSIRQEGALSFYDYLEREKETAQQKQTFLFSLNEESQIKILEERTLEEDTAKKFVFAGKRKAVEFLLQNDLRITSLDYLSFPRLLSLFEKNIKIPHQLLEENKFVSKIVSMEDPKDYRFLMKALERENDISFIEHKRKAYYEKEFKSFREKEKMFERYYQSYIAFCHQMEEDFSYEAFDQTFQKYFQFFGNDQEEYEYRNKVYHYLVQKEKEGLFQFFQQESNLKLTNQIIDYHFEDIYYNVLLDVKQLYQFQQTEGKTLREEEIETYKKLLELDTLPFEEKMKLHQTLKQENQIEKYYDAFRNAKDKAFQLIQEEMLTKEKLQKYKDEDASQKFGVNIYILDGDPFYTFIKSLNVSKGMILTERNLHSYVDGASYSLDSSKKLDTFHDPHNYYNILYGDFPVHQVVHMYPVDSFSHYRRDEREETPRVFELYTPSQFVTKSNDYNEIILAQKNERKKDELNEQLQLPTPLAIYCYDEILEEDIESAKETGLDITVVVTKNYSKETESDQISMHDTTGLIEGYKQEINYIRFPHENAMHGRRK